MRGYIRKDKLQNEYIWEKVGVAPIEEKMTKVRLWWFGHVQRRPPEALIRIVDQMVFNFMKRGRERLKRTLGDVIKM